MLTTAQQARVKAWVEAGPDPAVDGVVRWRRADLAAKMTTEFGITLATRTVGELLRWLGFRRLSARLRHPRQDADALETHKKNFADLIHATVPDHARGKPIEV